MPAPRKPDRRVERARDLRRAMTEAEKKLWWQLRQLPLANSHFRRQAAIGPYFADFASHKSRVVIEVDGGGHGEARQMAVDRKRSAYLKSRGYRVLRFWNNEVLQEIEGVMTLIYEAVQENVPPTPDPSPIGGLWPPFLKERTPTRSVGYVAARTGGGEPRVPCVEEGEQSA